MLERAEYKSIFPCPLFAIRDSHLIFPLVQAKSNAKGMMDEKSQPEITNDSKPPTGIIVTPDVASLIRAEVIAAVNHQARINSTELPSYASSNPPLNSSAHDVEGQQTTSATKEKPKPLRQTWMDTVRGTLGLFAIVIIFTLWMFLLATGLDPMRFSLLALFLLLSLCVFVVLVSLFPSS